MPMHRVFWLIAGIALGACGGGGGDGNSSNQPGSPSTSGQAMPASVCRTDQIVSHATMPDQFSAVLGWAQAVTLSAGAQSGPANVDVYYLRVIERDLLTGVTRVVLAEEYDRTRTPLQCDGGGCEGALWPRVPPCFTGDSGVPIGTSSVANGVLHVDLQPIPGQIAHWWTQRGTATPSKRYQVEVSFKVTGNAAIQFGADYWRTLSADYTVPANATCSNSNNCEAFVSDWYGDTAGTIVVKTFPP